MSRRDPSTVSADRPTPPPTALAALLVVVFASTLEGQEFDALRVRTELTPGPYLVGRGIELGVGVVVDGPRPRIAAPRLINADVWSIGTDMKPVSASGIGETVAQRNLYLTRFRIVPRRPGVLEIPPIKIRINDHAAASRPRRITVESVPATGRPAAFLGGVGAFTVESEVVPQSIRLGQEFEYRLTISGPAAWGTTEPPDLGATPAISSSARVEPRPVESINEPPSRRFVYRVRPHQAGEIVIPPVSIASYDPTVSRYLTKATKRAAVQVVGVPALDIDTIVDERAAAAESRQFWFQQAIWWAAAVVLGASVAALALVRKRLRSRQRLGPTAARQFAAGLGKSLGGNTSAIVDAETSDPAFDMALAIGDALVRYLEIGSSRPAGALTPEETRDGVKRLTSSDELGAQAASLLVRCDRVRFGSRSNGRIGPELADEARALFQALGRVRHRAVAGQSASAARDGL